MSSVLPIRPRWRTSTGPCWAGRKSNSRPEWVRLRAPEQERPGLSFQLENGHEIPVWPPRPGTQQMQAHLDVLVDDLEAETERACGLGATLEAHQPQEDVRVLRDPHGHPFCLFLPGA